MERERIRNEWTRGYVEAAATAPTKTNSNIESSMARTAFTVYTHALARTQLFERATALETKNCWSLWFVFSLALNIISYLFRWAASVCAGYAVRLAQYSLVKRTQGALASWIQLKTSSVSMQIAYYADPCVRPMDESFIKINVRSLFKCVFLCAIATGLQF